MRVERPHRNDAKGQKHLRFPRSPRFQKQEVIEPHKENLQDLLEVMEAHGFSQAGKMLQNIDEQTAMAIVEEMEKNGLASEILDARGKRLPTKGLPEHGCLSFLQVRRVMRAKPNAANNRITTTREKVQNLATASNTKRYWQSMYKEIEGATDGLSLLEIVAAAGFTTRKGEREDFKSYCHDMPGYTLADYVLSRKGIYLEAAQLLIQGAVMTPRDGMETIRMESMATLEKVHTVLRDKLTRKKTPGEEEITE